MLIIPEYKKEIPIYTSDTAKDILDRISIELKTSPEYLEISGLPPIQELLDNDIQVAVYDILNLARDDKQGMSFNRWIDNLPSSFQTLDDISKIKLWISQNINTNNDLFMLLVQNELDTKGIKFDITRFINRELEEYKKDLSRRLSGIREKGTKVKKIRQQLSDIKTQVKYTPLEITQLDYDLKTNLKLTPIEFFDKIRVGVNIPFITFSGFFKVVENFIPPVEWGIQIEDFLLMKLLTKTKLGLRERPEIGDLYSDILIYNEQSESLETSNSIIKMKLSNKNTPEERSDFIKSILGCIDDQVELLDSKQSGLAGKYFIPDFIVNNYIFADMALNDDLFSYYININETIKATKRKTSTFFKFVDPDNPQFKSVTVSIVNKLAEKKDIEIRGISRLDIPYGSNFLRVKIRSAPSRESIDNFMKVFSKLLKYYNKKYQEVVNFYKKYIPSFYQPEPKQKEIVVSKKLKDIAPDVFLPGFSRAVCPHKPEIIDKKDAKGEDYIVFPKSSEEGNQYLYRCPPENKEYKYIGVKLNKMDNRERYPVIPCCFQQNQKEKETSWYNKYMSGKVVIEKKDKKIPKMGLSVLNLKDYGGIPKSLDQLFYQIDPDYKYQRYGMSRSKSSFLECIVHALDINNFTTFSNEKRLDVVESLRKSRLFSDNAYLARQQLYDRDVSDIRDIIKSQDYLDPKLFIYMISQIYQCNIYVFTRKYRERDCNILIPRNIYGLYRIYRNDWPSIMIFENFGNEADNLDYPQCELLGRWDQKQSIPDFSQTDPLLKREIEIIYRKLFDQFEPQTNIVLPGKFAELFETQYIDNFGKTRFLQIGGEYFIMTSPLSVVAGLPIYQNIPRRKGFKIGDAFNFVKKAGLIVTGIHKEDMYLTEIKGNFALEMVNVDIYIPIEKTEVPAELKMVNEYIHQQFIDESGLSGELGRFRYNKKMAKCITSNLYHIYCKFISQRQLTPSFSNSRTERSRGLSPLESPLGTRSDIEEFIDKYIVLDEKHKYPEYPTININSGNGIIIRDKIIINSEEMLKRLLFQLRLTIDRDYKFLQNYRFVDKVDGYYQDIEDFEKRPNQIIVKGTNIIRNWYLINIDNFRIYNSIQPRVFTYFIQNSKIIGTDDIYVANTRSNLEDGFIEFYNLTEPPEFDLLIKEKSDLSEGDGEVERNDTWKRYRVPGIKTSFNIQVVGYKFEGKSQYLFIIPY